MTLLAELRRETRASHDRLEQRLDVPAQCRTQGGYAALLLAFRSVHAPLEAATAACPEADRALPDWRSRRKTGWLDEDLDALGVDQPAGTDPVDVPPLTCAEDVLGTAYVVEGATLGGAVIVRQLRESFADPPPHRYFSSYGARRGAQWRAFRVQAEAAHAEGLDADRVVEAARGTFALFEQRCAPATAR